jgi:DNA gyrase subunit A
MENTNERIDLVNIEDEMQRAYIDYSMSVIVGRALPDVRDGMKPGNRRILYAMKERGWTHSKAYVKCAKVVGEVIGNYHPHGDTAVYDTMVRMAQDFAMRGMLIDGQGNFGSIDGDRAAAYRYTECRLRPLAEEMLADIEKNTVDMRPNFDESLMEPSVLPARVPNLLVNGSTGIAVGMATNIPPHNLSEVVDGTIHLIDNPEATVEDLCEYVKGPDFPTGGMVYGLGAIRDFYTTGRGKIKMRGKAEIVEDDNGKTRIIISEIPYALNKTLLINKMVHLVRDKVLDGISDTASNDGTTFFITGIWSNNAVKLFLEGPVIFTDGFESGGTSGWSTTVN